MAIKINLVPAEILAKAAQKQQMLQAGAAGVALLVLLAMISAGHYFTLERLNRSLAEKNARLKKLEVIVAQVEELERTAAALRARLGVITDLLKGRTLYPYFMSDFVRSVPPGVRLKSVTTAGGGSAGGAIKLTMTAEGNTNDDIAVWMRKMEKFSEAKTEGEARPGGKFTNIELGPVNAGGQGYNFSVTAIYQP
jgi:Tfp pilus assembly protein PilN